MIQVIFNVQLAVVFVNLQLRQPLQQLLLVNAHLEFVVTDVIIGRLATSVQILIKLITAALGGLHAELM